MKFKVFFKSVFDFIFPKRDEVLAIENTDASEMLDRLPKAREMKEVWIKSIFYYKDKAVRRAIWEIKYNKNRALIEKMGMILYDLILEEISDKMCFENVGKVLIVPVSASKDRMKKYGFNQCELLVKEILKNDGGRFTEYRPNILKKIKDTKHQVKTGSRSERLQNIHGSMKVEGDVKGRFVIIIDDVVTTGATMREAKRVLCEAGAKEVVGFSIAH